MIPLKEYIDSLLIDSKEKETDEKLSQELKRMTFKDAEWLTREYKYTVILWCSA